MFTTACIAEKVKPGACAAAWTTAFHWIDFGDSLTGNQTFFHMFLVSTSVIGHARVDVFGDGVGWGWGGLR